MLSWIHVLSGIDVMTGAFALSVFIAGAGLALLAVFGVLAFRRAGDASANSVLWRSGLVLVGALVAWALVDRSPLHEIAAERRALEARAAELTARAISPGSALACLDAVASAAVEAACEKALFASPEAVAAAVAYVDARLSLLAAGVALAGRDPSYRPSLERLRRAIEADRFGLVAHVLLTRGCAGADCADLKLLRDSARILANMRARSFDARVAAHAAAWNPGGPAVAVAPGHAVPGPGAPRAAAPTAAGLAVPSLAVPGLAVPMLSGAVPSVPASTGPVPPVAMPAPPAAGGTARPQATGPVRYDFPSSDSIPAVSIMNAEPAAEPQAEPRPSATPQRRPQNQPARRQSSREPQGAPSAPLTVVPQVTTPPQTSGAR
jgi:hypothetical protein